MVGLKPARRVRIRRRRIAYAGISIAALVFLVMVLSLVRGFGVFLPRTGNQNTAKIIAIVCSNGGVALVLSSPTPNPSNHFFWGEKFGKRLWRWWTPPFAAEGPVMSIGVPLWWFVTGIVIVSTVMWFRGRPFPRGCCPDCGYDLRGSPSGHCPECGGISQTQSPEWSF